MGRLGTLFGYESFGVEPDIMTLAKGLGGGVPIGAFMAKDEACAFEPGDHGSTFGGNALTCAAGYASTKYIIDNNLPQHTAEMGERMGEALNTIKANNSSVSEVRGMGLLWAVLFNSDIGPDVVANCNNRGSADQSAQAERGQADAAADCLRRGDRPGDGASGDGDKGGWVGVSPTANR